jgi:hypothetical protein
MEEKAKMAKEEIVMAKETTRVKASLVRRS